MKLNNLKKQAKEKDFTFIDLMVAIAIIGVLASVVFRQLFPQFF